MFSTQRQKENPFQVSLFQENETMSQEEEAKERKQKKKMKNKSGD